MAKYNQKGRSRHRGFVMLRHDMMDSAAYRTLSPSDRAVYIEVLRRWNGTNNGEIPLSCREAAEKCNISNGTAARAFRTLKERGFLKVGSAAGFNMKNRTSTRWIVTHEAIDGKIAPSNEWRDWKPGGKKLEHGVTTDTYSVTRDTMTPKMIPEYPLTVSPQTP